MVPVNSHNHSDMFTMMRPFDKEELIFMQSSVEQIYDAFLDNVSKGRDLRKSFVDSVAQGRVWTGADALRLGLVDELGTLEDAVKYANSLVHIMFPGEGVQVEAYPKQKTKFEEIMSMVSENSVKANNILLGTPFEQMGNAIMDWKKTWNDNKQGKVYARMPYDIVFE